MHVASIYIIQFTFNAMKIEVLISCMHQTDASIIEQTRVNSNVLVVNQCDIDKQETFDFKNSDDELCKATVIYTTERGLSRSRNMAIYNADSDICLICDDDETLVNDYAKIILRAFEQHPTIDILTFKVHSPRKFFYSDEERKVGYIEAMKTASWQIAFRRESIVKNKIRFDEKMGSGTGNGGGEENKFLFDCIKKGLKIQYIPEWIASVAQTESQWFKGFTNEFFYNKGWTNRRLLGLPLAWCYIIYFSIMRRNKYRKDNTFFNALYYQFKGTFKRV